VSIICNIAGLDKNYCLNDFINFLLLSGRQSCAYHASHTHVRAVALSRSFGSFVGRRRTSLPVSLTDSLPYLSIEQRARLLKKQSRSQIRGFLWVSFGVGKTLPCTGIRSLICKQGCASSRSNPTFSREHICKLRSLLHPLNFVDPYHILCAEFLFARPVAALGWTAANVG
jgi:hypothetical protein